MLLSGGLSIAALSWLGRMNLELEGCFMLLISGTMGAAIGHTAVTLILGPLFFGRFLCGWGCWRSMVFEWLPVSASTKRREGFWRLLPLLGLGIVLLTALLAVGGFGHLPGGAWATGNEPGLFPIVLSFGAYYAAGIGLALTLKDQRAFCKYLCPSAVILRLTSRFSWAKMAARPGCCSECGTCSRVCPMNVDVLSFARKGYRVLSGDCILCQQCAQACPEAALYVSFRP